MLPEREREREREREKTETKKFSLGRVFRSSLPRRADITLHNAGVARLSSYYFKIEILGTLSLSKIMKLFPFGSFAICFYQFCAPSPPLQPRRMYISRIRRLAENSKLNRASDEWKNSPASRFDVPLNNRRPATGGLKTEKENLPSPELAAFVKHSPLRWSLHPFSCPKNQTFTRSCEHPRKIRARLREKTSDQRNLIVECFLIFIRPAPMRFYARISGAIARQLPGWVLNPCTISQTEFK